MEKRVSHLKRKERGKVLKVQQNCIYLTWLNFFFFFCRITIAQLNKNRGGSRGRVQGVRIPPWDDLRLSNTTGIQLVFCWYSVWFIGVSYVITSFLSGAPPPKKNPGSAPEKEIYFKLNKGVLSSSEKLLLLQSLSDLKISNVFI